MKASSSCIGLLSSILFGLVFCLIGGLFIGSGLNVLHIGGDSPRAPDGMTAGVGLVFFLAGMLVILRSGIRAAGVETALGAWLEYLIFLVWMAVFSIIFIWTGLGPSGNGGESGGVVFGLIGVAMGLGTAAYAFFRFPLRRV